MSRLTSHPNLAQAAEEAWRPPVLTAGSFAKARFANWIRRFLDLQAGSIWRDMADELPQVRGTVLDVGCGAQPYRGLLSPEVRYTAIDTADAHDHFGYTAPDTLYYRGDHWPVPDGSADLVLCTETLEHIADPRVFLAEAFRSTRPGGRLLLTVPFAARWHFIPYDYWRYTPSGLNKLLTEAGFASVHIHARGNRLTVACYKVMALILPMLFPQGHGPAAGLALRLAGLVLSPLLLILAIIAQVSLRYQGGDDCLGYTALGMRPRPEESCC